MDLTPASRDSMRLPAPLRLLVGSFVVAFLINLMPWSGLALQVCPDFVLLILLYWAIQEPQSVGQGLGFVFGLLMDVADSALLGQHALIYVVVIFFAQLLRVRVLQLNLPAQALHVGAILVLAQLMSVGLNLSMGREVSGVWLIFSPLLSAILWPAICVFLALPRFRLRPGQLID
ncbi:MAG: rod shape-determining protein MreD [Betaproteobacteria bacterium]